MNSYQKLKQHNLELKKLVNELMDQLLRSRMLTVPDKLTDRIAQINRHDDNT